MAERADATEGPKNILQPSRLVHGALGRTDRRSAVAGLRGGELAGLERLRSFLGGAAGPGSSGAGAPAAAYSPPSTAHANGLAEGAAPGAIRAPSAAPIQVRLASRACD